MLTGCQPVYHRELKPADDAISQHRFTKVEFVNTGHLNSFMSGLLNGRYDWRRESIAVLVADDGWRLAILPPGPIAYNRFASEDAGATALPDPVTDDRLILIDPEGGQHPVKVTVGALGHWGPSPTRHRLPTSMND